MFQSAEAWLDARGVRCSQPRTQRPDEAAPKGPTDGVRSQAPTEDGVAAAAAYARRATAQAPRSEQRLREALARRGYPAAIVEAALERCRSEGTVDDCAFAKALVEEARSKGHAPRRIRADLTKRGLPVEIITAVLATVGDRDPEAAAYAFAAARAARLRAVDAQTAYRRLVGYLIRRGHEEPLARKVARQAVFNDREPMRVAER